MFVQIEGLVEGLMHVSETPLARGEKPQDHYKEGDAVRAPILRIEDAEMKVGSPGVNVDEAAARGRGRAAAPRRVAAPAAPAPVEGEAAAPKKKRSRKKADEPAKE